ncbi:hypothetical protein CJ030_MR2G016979 [Morella rubra]|uniref:DUF7356 domain-containing protein n=1 Tax=Morella rubra TaxID=262757 RepID=A0A6A1WH34_9ROSI|nr:hypothetical protein CJ030_MR2G016979 [Morella rubra]
MDKNAFLGVLFLFLIVADVSDASMLSNLRKLVGAAPTDDNATDVSSSPSPSPVPGNKKSDPNPKDGSKNREPEPPIPNNSAKVDPKGPPTELINNSNTTNSNNNEGSNGTNQQKKDGEKTENVQKANNTKDQQKKDEEKTENSQTVTSENCDGLSPKCKDQGNMTACIKSFRSAGTKELVILVQNGKEKALKVNLTVESTNHALEIPKHQTERVSFQLTHENSSKFVLDAGKGECVLRVDPPVAGNPFVRLPSFDKLLTPVNGAYLLILTLLVFGGTWTCCKCRKRRHQGGVPYQELEMGLPESVSSANVETAEGWDQVWDDDWDEDNAVKAPGGRLCMEAFLCKWHCTSRIFKQRWMGK